MHSEKKIRFAWLKSPVSKWGLLDAVIFIPAWISVAIGCVALIKSIFPGSMNWGLLLVPFVYFTVIAIHEFGHLIGARMAGMIATQARVSVVELIAQARGWRWRYCMPSKTVDGFLVALPNPSKPMRFQLIVMTMSGPLANLLVGIAFSLMSFRDRGSGWGAFVFGFAVFNACVAIVNLLPMKRHPASDGYLLRQLLFGGFSETSPDLLSTRLNSLCITGVTADQLPEDDLLSLAAQPAPMPLIHLWFQVKAHQNRLEWNEAAKLEEKFETILAEMPDELMNYCKHTVVLLGCEIRFSAAMADIPHVKPLDDGIDKNLDWYQPHVRPRFLALAASLDGDVASMEKHLSVAKYWSDRSVDKALNKSESVIRAAIEAKCEKSYA